ncbi:MAG: hypothetical protein JXR84_14625 [Anaerolineae bacterium]|nr:hypothetical protein [Anaerolineae bacterium]
MTRKKERPSPEQEELKRILGRLGRRKRQKKKDKGSSDRPPENKSPEST